MAVVDEDDPDLSDGEQGSREGTRVDFDELFDTSRQNVGKG